MTPCPQCGADFDPDKSIRNNSGKSVSIDIPVAMLAALEHALAIGRNCA